jgi:4-hydroxybenzoate polyprenyltransferase
MANRWWVYQRERFPIVGHGLLIAAFSFSAVSYSALLREQDVLPGWKTVVVAFITSFLFFLGLRIADEFKDFEEDSRYRPYRPVPRGLVSLRELGVLGGLCALVQLGLALWLDPPLVWLLTVVWIYLTLMTKEFFVGEWLKARPILYLVSHMAIIPLVDLYATACDWRPVQSEPPHGLIWFLIVSYFNGVVIEIGRKVRAPKDEEPGVNTYSHLWGYRTAALVWLGAMLVTAGFALVAAHRVDFSLPVACVLAILIGSAALVVWRFVREPTVTWAKRIEALSGVWTILMYLSLGAAPLLWRALGAER